MKIPAVDSARYFLTDGAAEYHRAQFRGVLEFRLTALEAEVRMTAGSATEVCPVALVEDRQR
ncbi:hypothetical protein [Actinomadura mexicana]|uniref:hypothetical protein n=1 Tax=Actinomadura mexicana TaxID=134959 RepID=UPI0015C5F0CB|nr:hypothetical protein [Actinomadura mexicana]